MTLRFLFAIGLMVLGLTACSVTAPLRDDEKQAHYGKLAENPFMPVNALINSGDFVNQQQSEALAYLGEQLKQSGAFARVDVGVERWPVTLDLNYKVQASTGAQAAADTANMLLAACTLFVIPGHHSSTHRLSVEILYDNVPVKKLLYSETVDERLWLFEMGQQGKGARAGIDRLLTQMIDDLQTQKLVPRMADFEAQQAADRGQL